MSILTQLVYSLEVKLNLVLQVLEFEHPMQDPDLQVNALIETSSAKIKTRNRIAIRNLIDTLKFIGLVRHFFQWTLGQLVSKSHDLVLSKIISWIISWNIARLYCG